MQPLLRSKRGFAGELLVTVKRAVLDVGARKKDLKNMLCLVKCGGNHFFTPAASALGGTPTWESSFRLSLDGDEENLEIHLLKKADLKNNFVTEFGKCIISLVSIVPILNPSYAEDDDDCDDDEQVKQVLALIANMKISNSRKAHIKASLSANFFKPQAHWVELNTFSKGKVGERIGKIRLSMCFIPNRKAPILTAEQKQTLQEARTKKKEEEKARLKRQEHEAKNTAAAKVKPAAEKDGFEGFLSRIWTKKTEKKKVFGRTIEEDTADSCYGVPNIVVETINFLLAKDRIKTEGIFRIPGNSDTITFYKDQYNKLGKGVSFDVNDIHSCAGVLKLYFRLLETPVISYELYSPLLEISCILEPNGRLIAYQTILEDMSGPCFDSLGYLCRFLKKVSNHKGINKMSASNLAVVFAPNILVSKDKDPLLTMAEIPKTIKCLSHLIEHASELFPEDEEKEEEKESVIKEKIRRASVAVQSNRRESIVQEHEQNKLKSENILLGGEKQKKTPPSDKKINNDHKGQNREDTVGDLTSFAKSNHSRASLASSTSVNSAKSEILLPPDSSPPKENTNSRQSEDSLKQSAKEGVERSHSQIMLETWFEENHS